MDRSGAVPAAKPRKELNWWHSFNSWWRDEYDKLGRRPRMQEVDEWYHENAERVWGTDKPSLEATRDHAKCLRSKKELREYFQRYNAKKQFGRPFTDMRQMRGGKAQRSASQQSPASTSDPGGGVDSIIGEGSAGGGGGAQGTTTSAPPGGAQSPAVSSLAGYSEGALTPGGAGPGAGVLEGDTMIGPGARARLALTPAREADVYSAGCPVPLDRTSAQERSGRSHLGGTRLGPAPPEHAQEAPPQQQQQQPLSPVQQQQHLQDSAVARQKSPGRPGSASDAVPSASDALPMGAGASWGAGAGGYQHHAGTSLGGALRVGLAYTQGSGYGASQTPPRPPAPPTRGPVSSALLSHSHSLTHSRTNTNTTTHTHTLSLTHSQSLSHSPSLLGQTSYNGGGGGPPRGGAFGGLADEEAAGGLDGSADQPRVSVPDSFVRQARGQGPGSDSADPYRGARASGGLVAAMPPGMALGGSVFADPSASFDDGAGVEGAGGPTGGVASHRQAQFPLIKLEPGGTGVGYQVPQHGGTLHSHHQRPPLDGPGAGPYGRPMGRSGGASRPGPDGDGDSDDGAGAAEVMSIGEEAPELRAGERGLGRALPESQPEATKRTGSLLAASGRRPPSRLRVSGDGEGWAQQQAQAEASRPDRERCASDGGGPGIEGGGDDDRRARSPLEGLPRAPYRQYGHARREHGGLLVHRERSAMTLSHITENAAQTGSVGGAGPRDPAAGPHAGAEVDADGPGAAGAASGAGYARPPRLISLALMPTITLRAPERDDLPGTPSFGRKHKRLRVYEADGGSSPAPDAARDPGVAPPGAAADVLAEAAAADADKRGGGGAAGAARSAGALPPGAPAVRGGNDGQAALGPPPDLFGTPEGLQPGPAPQANLPSDPSPGQQQQQALGGTETKAAAAAAGLGPGHAAPLAPSGSLPLPSALTARESFTERTGAGLMLNRDLTMRDLIVRDRMRERASEREREREREHDGMRERSGAPELAMRESVGTAHGPLLMGRDSLETRRMPPPPPGPHLLERLSCAQSSMAAATEAPSAERALGPGLGPAPGSFQALEPQPSFSSARDARAAAAAIGAGDVQGRVPAGSQGAAGTCGPTASRGAAGAGDTVGGPAGGPGLMLEAGTGPGHGGFGPGSSEGRNGAGQGRDAGGSAGAGMNAAAIDGTAKRSEGSLAAAPPAATAVDAAAGLPSSRLGPAGQCGGSVGPALAPPPAAQPPPPPQHQVIFYPPQVQAAVMQHTLNGRVVEAPVQMITLQLTLPADAVEALCATNPAMLFDSGEGL